MNPQHDLSTGDYLSEVLIIDAPSYSVIQIINDGNIDGNDVKIKIYDSLDGVNFSEVKELETVIDNAESVTTIRAIDWHSTFMKVEILAGSATAGIINKINFTK